MAQAKRDNNHVPTILGVSATDSTTPVPIEADAATKSLKVTIAGGSSSGTEYTEGDVDATMSGGAIVFKGSGNTATVPSSTNPLPISQSYTASATLSTATLVAAADRVDAIADVDGAHIIRANSTLADVVSGNASNTDGASTQVIASSGAGVKTYLTDVTITNTSASNIYVEMKDGTTVKWTFPVPANGGVTHHFTTPLAGTAATAWNFDPSAATTTVYCSAAGFKSKI